MSHVNLLGGIALATLAATWAVQKGSAVGTRSATQQDEQVQSAQGNTQPLQAAIQQKQPPPEASISVESNLVVLVVNEQGKTRKLVVFAREGYMATKGNP